FSSRGRHTRFSRDWSSDVCSSDLAIRVIDGEAVFHRKGIYQVLGGLEAAPAIQRRREMICFPRVVIINRAAPEDFLQVLPVTGCYICLVYLCFQVKEMTRWIKARRPPHGVQ